MQRLRKEKWQLQSRALGGFRKPQHNPEVLGAVGAGLGAVIGSTRPGKEVVVYRAPGASGSARLSLALLMTPRTKGVAVAVTI